MKSYFKLIITIAIFLSSYSMAQAREYTLNEFIDEFVSKPFSLTDAFDDRFLNAQYLLCKRTKPELRLIRNAVFASHGYIFKDPALRDFFSGKKWYKPTIADISEIDLSTEEEDNIKYLKELESDPSFDDFVKLFKKSKLPITIIPSGTFSTVGKDKGITLPPQYFIKFFKNCPGIYPYYQQNLIFQNSNFIAVTYGVAVPAGAGYDGYFLVSFTPQGELIDQMLLGRSGAAELGRSWSFTALINEKLEISVREITIADDDSSEGTNQGKKKFYADKKYFITSNGKFTALSKTESKTIK